jgi:hypothetical protein
MPDYPYMASNATKKKPTVLTMPVTSAMVKAGVRLVWVTLRVDRLRALGGVDVRVRAVDRVFRRLAGRSSV